jgi:AcrR family transcriptional regulator
LTREHVLNAAIELADEAGVEALTMRRLGQALGVEAMSLYKHVTDKEDILDGLADLVTSEFDVPARDGEWRPEIRRSTISAHDVLARHPWASVLIESRVAAGPARLRYLDATIGVLRGAGFSLPTTLRAIMALDSHTYGFTLQEASWPIDPANAPDAAATFAEAISADEYPHMHAMAEMVSLAAAGAPVDFAFGLDLILDGLERLRHTA